MVVAGQGGDGDGRWGLKMGRLGMVDGMDA
jgi:hypothetical protein